MKTILLFISMAAIVQLSTSIKLSEEERQMAVKEMTATHDHLNSALVGLTEEQLNFKPDETTWSIAECVEHIAISEENIFGMLQGALQTPADASRRNEVKIGDKELLTMIVDRSNRVKTTKPFEPTGKYGSHAQTYATFKKKRASHIEFVKSTDEDLRNHYAQLPLGTIDGYQVLLFMSAHTERHIRQIEEVKNHSDFPNN